MTKRLPASLAVLAALALAPSVLPCCAVGPSGYTVAFGGQNNIIVWNQATQTQHFIRDARFATEADSLGFLAPSPSRPELEEADEAAFRTLHSLAPRPRVALRSAESVAAAAGEVEVVEEKDVAGFRAAVLKATDATALAKWLKDNSYQSRPDIEGWLKHYVDKGWYITGFKVKTDTASGRAKTGVVRMTFKTSQPFNPYLVPSGNRKANVNAGINLYFISQGLYQGKVGGTDDWNGEAQWSQPLKGQSLAKLAGELKLAESYFPSDAQVTLFTDRTFPNSAPDDVFFSKTSSLPMAMAYQTPMEEASRTAAWVVSGGVGVLAIALLIIKKRRAKAEA